MERLIFALVVHGVELIGAVENGGRANLPHIRQAPGTEFQGAVRDGAGVIVAADHFYISGAVQPQHHANPGHPVEAEIGKGWVVHIVRAAVKNEDCRKASGKGAAYLFIIAHMVVQHHFHIPAVFLAFDPGA